MVSSTMHFILLLILAIVAGGVDAFTAPHQRPVIKAAKPTSMSSLMATTGDGSGDITTGVEIENPTTRRQWFNDVMVKTAVLPTAAALSAGMTCNPSKALADEAEASPSSLQKPYKVEMIIQIDRNDPSTEYPIEIEVLPEWAPLASQRFKELVDIQFFDDSRFFRVLPNYVAQFGIASDPKVNMEWLLCEKSCKSFPDEPRKQNNKAGTLSFATSGKNTRQTQIFINLVDNSGVPNFLDAQNFIPFARVTKGFDTAVKKINSEYGLRESMTGGMSGSVSQGKAMYYGKEYLDTVFPRLSIIKSVKII